MRHHIGGRDFHLSRLGDLDRIVAEVWHFERTAQQTTIGGSALALSATAADNVAVTKVEFYMNNTLLGTDTAAPYVFGLNTTLYPNGSYTLTTKAYDAANNSTTSSTVTVTINNVIPDTTPPSVIITAPFTNTTISGVYTVSATAADASGIAKVDFSVDGGAVLSSDTTSPYSYDLNTVTLTNAIHTIKVTAYDSAGNSNSATATVTVSNTATPPPTVKKCDFNHDNLVDTNDLFILLANFNNTVPANTKGDCNNDTKVDTNDLFILLGVYGK